MLSSINCDMSLGIALVAFSAGGLVGSITVIALLSISAMRDHKQKRRGLK